MSGMVNTRGHVSRQLTFSFPAIRHRVVTRQLGVNIVPLRKPSGRENGWTAIQIGAWDDWVVARDPDEVVPSGIRAIEIRKGSLLVHRVTALRTIATIVHWFDALPVSPPAGPCGPPGVRGDGRFWPERIAFVGGSGQVVARAKDWLYGTLSTACAPISFSVGRHSFPPLVGGRFLIRVENLLR